MQRILFFILITFSSVSHLQASTLKLYGINNNENFNGSQLILNFDEGLAQYINWEKVGNNIFNVKLMYTPNENTFYLKQPNCDALVEKIDQFKYRYKSTCKGQKIFIENEDPKFAQVEDFLSYVKQYPAPTTLEVLDYLRSHPVGNCGWITKVDKPKQTRSTVAWQGRHPHLATEMITAFSYNYYYQVKISGEEKLAVNDKFHDGAVAHYAPLSGKHDDRAYIIEEKKPDVIARRDKLIKNNGNEKALDAIKDLVQLAEKGECTKEIEISELPKNPYTQP